MCDEPRSGRPWRAALIGASLFLLGLGASTVFSQAPTPAERDPERELLLARKEALQAELTAAIARVDQAKRRLKNAQAANRAKLQSDDYLLNAELDVSEREAVVARKRAELAELAQQSTQTRQAYHRGTPQEGSTVDITDDLLRRIKDLEARVEKLEGRK